MCNRAYARLLTLDDPLWRRPFYSSKESGGGIVAPDPNAVSRRLVVAGALSRLGGGDSVITAGKSESRPLLHQHARGIASGTKTSAAATQRHETDRNDHRRQAVGPHLGRRAHLQERIRARSAGCQPDARGSFKVQAGRRADQYLYAGLGLWLGAICAESHRDVPRQSVLYDSLHPRTIPADGLHVAEDQDHPLAIYSKQTA